MSPFEVENRVGRLVEVRIAALRRVDDVAAIQSAFRDAVRKSGAPSVIICADYRELLVFSPVVAERFKGMLTGANPVIDRSALLCSPDHATVGLQIERTVRESGHPLRKTFRDPASLAAWLEDALDVRERARLRLFLGLKS